MDISPTTIAFIGVGVVVLGIMAGLLINTFSDGGDDAPVQTDEAPPGGRKGRYTPVFRAWREKGTGKLVVEMDGKAYIAPDPLNQIQRERLESTVRDLRGWLGMGLTGSEAAAYPPDAVQSPTAGEDDLRRAIAPPPSAPVPQPVRPAPYQPPIQSVSTAETPRAGIPPLPLPLPGIKEDALPKPAARSIVMQIEDILQDMLIGTPLERRGIHLLEDPIRGVIVQVGIDHYEGIDSVPDAEVKGFIQSAVKEWEKTQ